MPNDEDEFPDDFGNIDWDAIGIPVLGQVSISPQVVRLQSSNSSNSSTHYSCDDDEVDAAFLAELDALEERALHEGLLFF